MNRMFRRASRLIAVGALAIVVPTLADASDIERGTGFKLAMGPMSAPQRNQGNSAAEMAPAEPHYHFRHRHRHKHHMH
jgi:hypothetical protein